LGPNGKIFETTLYSILTPKLSINGAIQFLHNQRVFLCIYVEQRSDLGTLYKSPFLRLRDSIRS